MKDYGKDKIGVVGANSHEREIFLRTLEFRNPQWIRDGVLFSGSSPIIEHGGVVHIHSIVTCACSGYSIPYLLSSF